MKFPKLKNTFTCRMFIFSPAVFWMILSVFIWRILDKLHVHGRGIIGLICFVALGLFTIWYLLRFMFILSLGDVTCSQIHAWQRDRLEFYSRINGSSRERALSRIMCRCRLWGRRWKNDSNTHFIVYYKHAYSWTVFRSMIEKRVVICQEDHLTADRYDLLINQAQSVLKRMPLGKIRFQTKDVKRMPRAYCSLIVILADRVDEDVKSKARVLPKASPKNDDNACILPCVAECPSGHYYMNGGKEPLFMPPRPPRNMTRGMARRLVFAVGLPKKNPDKRPPLDVNINPDSTLWEFLRENSEIIKEDKKAEKKEIIKMLRHLSEGEVKIGEIAVYYKKNGRVTMWAYLLDNEDENVITLIPGDMWYYQKDCFKNSIAFKREISKRVMKKAQIKEADSYIRKTLKAAGMKVVDVIE